jgi:murein DD-endopeptidase MepM/ murein hydrolase activator NlpD
VSFLTFQSLKRRPVHAGLITLATVAVTATSAFAAGSGGIGSGGTPGGGTGGYGGDVGEGVFPVRAKHTYGDGMGAGRGHDGMDLMAKCGKPIVSAYSGRVQLVDTHSSAGNYVVIDGAGKLQDTVYMHLQDKAEVRKGQKVAAGDLLGLVGDTGNASACHLHFEIWSNPGYYEGGDPVDPEPYLRSWDRKRKGARK